MNPFEKLNPDDVVGLIGRQANDPAVVAILRACNFKTNIIFDNYKDELFLMRKDWGFCIHLEPEGGYGAEELKDEENITPLVSSVSFHSRCDYEFSSYTGVLPFKLNWDHTRDQVRAKIGMVRQDDEGDPYTDQWILPNKRHLFIGFTPDSKLEYIRFAILIDDHTHQYVH